MANMMVDIAVLLAVSSLMATAAILNINKEGVSLCDFDINQENCLKYGECLTLYGYSVNNPCNDEEVKAANVQEHIREITVCTLNKTINSNGGCDTPKQTNTIESQVQIQNVETKVSLIEATNKCSDQHDGNCTAAQQCALQRYVQICYPGSNLDIVTNLKVL